MSEERLNEIIENINKHNILQSCCGGMTSYDCMINELLEHTLDLQQRIDKAIEELNNPAYDDAMLCKNIDNAISILKGKDVK